MLAEGVVGVGPAGVDTNVVTLWLCPRPRRPQSLLSRNEPRLDSSFLFLVPRQPIARTVPPRTTRHKLQPKRVLVKVHAAEAADMDEARAWQSMVGVVQLCVVVALSNFLPCKLHPMLVPRDRATTSRDVEAPLDTTDNPRETLRVIGETSLKAKLRLKTSKVPWATSKVNSSKVVDSSLVTATVDP